MDRRPRPLVGGASCRHILAARFHSAGPRGHSGSPSEFPEDFGRKVGGIPKNPRGGFRKVADVIKTHSRAFKWSIWSPRQLPLPEQPHKHLRISLCVTCMGRSHDLKETLIRNIQDNEDYPNLEFVVLNYNSPDDMHEFMTSAAVLPYIQSGTILYLITKGPKFYSGPHSRNLAFRNATGEIVSSVDADNFTGKGFATYLNRLASVCPQKAFFARGKRRIHGRIGMYKNEFEQLGGYDEDLEGYGFDDHSLMIRAMNSGCKLMWWARGSGVEFANRIWTPRDRIAENMANRNWKETEIRNTALTMAKIGRGELVANRNRIWGYAEDLVAF
jgi:hypothetical protein